MMKVFDCQDMPDDVREKFFKLCSGGNSVGNDCYVTWYPVHPFFEEEGVLIVNEDCSIVDTWLLENGANEDETVIVQHWW